MRFDNIGTFGTGKLLGISRSGYYIPNFLVLRGIGLKGGVEIQSVFASGNTKMGMGANGKLLVGNVIMRMISGAPQSLDVQVVKK